MKRFMLIFACLLLMVGSAMAQSTRKVTGSVTNAATGEALMGARVFVNGTSYGTVTDAKGTFTISNLPARYKQLTVSYFGMQTQLVPVASVVNVKMKENAKMLNETVVVAYGTQKKSAFTGSAKVVGSEELELSQVSSVTDALAGAVPGVQLTSSNGAPGSTSTIRIRGFSSLNAGKDPLIIVDGAPYEGDIANLNPADIESMTVQKDAASNALYGARGANGVIMITTKKAKSGDAVVKFDAKWGANSQALQHYDVVTSPAQYYEMQYAAMRSYYMNNGMTATEAWKEANANLCNEQGDGGLGYNVYTVPEGQYLIGENGKLNPYATLGRIVNYKGEDYLLTPDDWEDQGTRIGRRQEYNVSFSQGSDYSNIYASLGYLDNQGTTANSNMERLTARLKADFQVKPWMKIGANMSYTRFSYDSFDSDNNGNSTSTANIWAFTSQMAPIYPVFVRNADGSIKIDGNGIRMYDYGNGMNAGLARPFISDANPLQDNQLNTYNSEGNAATGYGFADFYIIKGLTATVNGTYNLDETRFNYVYNPYYGQFDTTEGTVGMQHSRYYSYNLQQLLNYTFDLGKNSFTLLAGHEYTNKRNYYLYASKSKMFSQSNKELNGAVVDGQSAGSYKNEYNNEGYFFRALYEYDGKYFANGSIRRDASSRFAKNHRWGTFWSLGAAWMISKENWFKASWVDQLKLKASIGQQGNDNIGSYQYTDLYDITNSAGAVGTSFSSKGNDKITWETKTNTNVGFEFSLFKKLTGSIEYFYGKTTDMLFQFTVAPSLGYTSYYSNVGDLYNSGIELDLSYNIIKKKNFSWDVNFNMTTLRNRFTYLDPAKKTTTLYNMDGKAYQGYVSGNFFVAEGTSIYTWRLKEYAGVYSEKTWTKTADAAYDDTKAGLSMWYYRTPKLDDQGNQVKDSKGNVVYENKTTTTWADADYYVTDKTTVPSVYGGFGTKLQFYGFDFAINFSYSLGGKAYDATYAQFMSSPTTSNTGYNFHKDLLKSWGYDGNNLNSDIPRFMLNDTYSAASSTRFLTNASYLNCENINLGYTIPDKYTRKLLISNLRIYCSAENVFYVSARKGFDPRQTYTGSSNATRYAPMRTISGGISLTF